jgi:VWFA-related protein
MTTKSRIASERATSLVAEQVRPRIAAPQREIASPFLTNQISRRGLLISFASIFSARRVLKAQQTEGGAPAIFSSDTSVVSVLATVRNHQGQIVRGLNKDDFALEEEGRPQVIRYFSQETNLPLTLGLLVDTSLSQRRVLGEERAASYSFLDRMLREKDLAFLIHFDREVELLQDLTSVRRDLETAMDKLQTPERPQWARGSGGGYPGGGNQGGGYPGGGGGYPGGQRGRRGGAGTILYDAVYLGSDDLMKRQQGRKAMIVLSDGVDTGSKTTLNGAIEAAQRSDTLVYCILFSDEQAYGSPGGFGRMGGYGGMGGRRGGMGRGRYPQQSRPDGKKILEQLSKETGGAMFEVSKKQTVAQIYDRIEEELRNQYSLGYTPETGRGPGYRKIHVAAKQKGLTVQARDGYYARS